MASTDDRYTTILSTEGRFILPNPMRDRRHWPAGARLIVEDTADGVLLKPEPVFAPATIDVVFGSLGHSGSARSLEDMEAAIMTEAKRRARD